MLSHSPPERFSEDARNEASVPFLLSAGCSALRAHPDGRTVPLGGRLGFVQPASQPGIGTALIPPHGPLVRPESSALGSHGRGSSSVQGLGGIGAMSGRELRSPGTFLSLCLDGNRYLGSRRGSEKREGEGAGSSGLKLCSLLLDRLFLRRGFQQDMPQYKCSLLVMTGTLLNSEEADVSFCTPLLL